MRLLLLYVLILLFHKKTRGSTCRVEDDGITEAIDAEEMYRQDPLDEEDEAARKARLLFEKSDGALTSYERQILRRLDDLGTGPDVRFNFTRSILPNDRIKRYYGDDVRDRLVKMSARERERVAGHDV